MYPTFGLYEATPGAYFPSLIEISSVVGTIGMVTLFFLLVAKVIPVVELHAIEHLNEKREGENDGERGGGDSEPLTETATEPEVTT